IGRTVVYQLVHAGSKRFVGRCLNDLGGYPAGKLAEYERLSSNDRPVIEMCTGGDQLEDRFRSLAKQLFRFWDRCPATGTDNIHLNPVLLGPVFQPSLFRPVTAR